MKSWGLFLLLISTIVLAQNEIIWQLSFPQTNITIDKWLKENSFAEQRGSAKNWQVGNEYLTMVQDDDSTTIGTELSLSTTSPLHIQVEFMVETLPTGADLRFKASEDSAFRVFVIFDKGGGWLSPPNTLTYAYGTNNLKGQWLTSERFDNVKTYIVESGTQNLGKWLSFDRDIVADYRNAFAIQRVPKIIGLGIKCDANDTEKKAKARLRRIVFHKNSR